MMNPATAWLLHHHQYRSSIATPFSKSRSCSGSRHFLYYPGVAWSSAPNSSCVQLSPSEGSSKASVRARFVPCDLTLKGFIQTRWSCNCQPSKQQTETLSNSIFFTTQFFYASCQTHKAWRPIQGVGYNWFFSRDCWYLLLGLTQGYKYPQQ